MRRDRSQKTVIASANSLWNIDNFRAGLLRAITARGFAVKVAAPADATRQDPAARPWAVESLTVDSRGINPISDLLLLARYWRLLRRERPAVYLSWTPKPNIYGALAARLAGIPSVPNVSGLGTAFIRGGWLQRLVVGLYRAAFRRCPAVFFQNREDREWFIRKRLVRSEQARLLPGSGVDLDRFAERPMTNSPTEDVRLLFVGRLLGDKGVREFVEAAKRVNRIRPGVRFQLLGFNAVDNRTAIPNAELQGWLKEGAVEYLGATDDVRPFLEAATAVVLPSYREGVPRSLIEAAAVGRPLLASDIAGNREVVRPGENGQLFEVRSADSLERAILEFLGAGEAEWRRMGSASRRIAEERFSERKVISAYLDLLDEVAGATRPPETEGSQCSSS